MGMEFILKWHSSCWMWVRWSMISFISFTYLSLGNSTSLCPALRFVCRPVLHHYDMRVEGLIIIQPSVGGQWTFLCVCFVLKWLITGQCQLQLLPEGVCCCQWKSMRCLWTCEAKLCCDRIRKTLVPTHICNHFRVMVSRAKTCFKIIINHESF